MDCPSQIRAMLTPKHLWVKDQEATSCYCCSKEFIPFLRWRHHCRFCGQVFCSKCAENIIYGENINYKEEKRLRHCNQCHRKIQMKIANENKEYFHKSELFDEQENLFKLDVDDPSKQSMHETGLCDKIKMLDQQIIDQLYHLSKIVCAKYGLEQSTWQFRLADLALKAVSQTKVNSYLRPTLLNLSKQIRVLTIITPKDCVTAVCVKGLILERNIPSKQLETHLKYPNILTVKPAIQTESLMSGNDLKFDEMVKNENNILRNYLSKIYRLKPHVIFTAEHVSRVALELLLQNKIMVISKVKLEDLEIIEKLALIRKRIDNLLFIDKYQDSDLVGVVERIYFKTVKQGVMLLFIEHEAGIRSVLLGDFSEEINQQLKKGFDWLLKAAWNMKKEKELISKDFKVSQGLPNIGNFTIVSQLSLEKYQSLQMLNSNIEVRTTKIIYKCRKMEQIPKAYENYCNRLSRWAFLQVCQNQIMQQKIKLYQGEDLSIGIYILNSLIFNDFKCKKCQCQHFERYFIEDYSVSVRVKNYSETKAEFYEEEQEEKKKQAPPFQIYKTILRYFKHFKEQLYFNMFFQCQSCEEIIGNQVKVGKEFLTMDLTHFFTQIIESYKRANTSCHSYQPKKRQDPCDHNYVVRVIQTPKAQMKFYVCREQTYEISQIILAENMVKVVQNKDQKMMKQLYSHQVLQKQIYLQDIESQLMRMPFNISSSSSFISISGQAPHEHIYYDCFIRLLELLQKMRINLGEIEKTISIYFQQVAHDWTVVMRKFYKLQYALRIMIDLCHFISNSLKKEKIHESNSFEEINFNESQENSLTEKVRKYSQHLASDSLFKANSMLSLSQFPASIRKETLGSEMESQLDSITQKFRRQRFTVYQGVHLYFPIGNIHDPVSLLACCLNSQDFAEAVSDKNYKDFVSNKIKFVKQIKTDWAISKQLCRMYKQVTKEEYDKNQQFQYYFSTYYHRQFQQLRQYEGISFKLFVRSLYGCQNWDSSGGKSNSSFSKSHNDILVVKIINEKQFVQFQKFAPAYLMHMKTKREKNQMSYLAKIYGIYQATIRNKQYKFVVMQNIFFGMSGALKVYDLKGSQVNRLATPSGNKPFTGLDTNFIIDKDGKPYILEGQTYEKTMSAFESDANFLKQQSVIDYSLLVIESERELRMGIIDFMRPYHLIEIIESNIKYMKTRKDPTVIPPYQYSERFISALKKYFIKVK